MTAFDLKVLQCSDVNVFSVLSLIGPVPFRPFLSSFLILLGMCLGNSYADSDPMGNSGWVTMHAEGNDANGNPITYDVQIPFKSRREKENAIARAEIASGFAMASGIPSAAVRVFKDPSVAYSYELANPSSEPRYFATSIDFPIDQLPDNTVFGELTVELFDENNDGQVLLSGDFGDENAIQGVSLRNSTTFEGVQIGQPLGTSVSTPGKHEFNLDAMAGPTLEGGDEISVSTFFTLSPGDRALVTSRFIIDEGSGIPFVEIPSLPSPDDGPFFNVIDVDSPESSIGDNQWIGAQTQLNLSEGGSIGNRFNFDAFLNNQVSDNNFDIEVNVTGGTVGNQFMALGGTTVNISGGTFEGNFLAGSYEGQSTDVEVNISGGSVSAGFSGELQAYAGSEVNILGGTVGSVSAAGGQVNIKGGTVGRQFFNNSIEAASGGVLNINGGEFPGRSGISLLDGSVANISGGSFTTEEHQLQALPGSTINLFGTDFLIDGIEIENLVYGAPMEITDRDVTLSGLLADGSPFSIDLASADPFPDAGDWVHPDAILTVTIGLPGDFDMDGDVDGADFLLWQRGGSPTPRSQSDLSLWKSNFDASVQLAASQAAVPEPNTLLLVVMHLILIQLDPRLLSGNVIRGDSLHNRFAAIFL